MEPRIQYAKTADGVSIAYWTMGQGMPLVHMPLPYSHLQLEWEYPEYRHWYERLAQNRLIVRYDGRGSGLSERVTTGTLETSVLDLEAVVDRLGLGRLALFGLMHTGPPAIVYAARHPERVSHLILWCTYTQQVEWGRSPSIEATRAMIERDWTTFTEAVAHVLLGWSQGEPARRFAALIRECITPKVTLAGIRAMLEIDLKDVLPMVRAPTLVLHRRSVPFLAPTAATSLSSGIPDARLVLLEGESGAPYLGDTEAVLRAIAEFLGEGEEAKGEDKLPEGTAIILFTDIAGSTALTERLGDAAFRAKARELDERLRSVIRESGGTPVEGKVLGDGVMAVFTSARQAIECALRCNAAVQDAGLSLHLGIHAGDIIREGNTVYGGAVNIAARIAAASQPGEVLVSDTVRGLARTSANVVFEDRGEHELKGVGDPQRLFAVTERS